MIIVEIAGFLGADPEERFTTGGKKVTSLRVGVHVREGGQDDTVWWRVNIWDERFARMLPHMKKGSAVMIVGKMKKPKTYTGRDGTVQVAMELNAEMMEFSPFGRPGERSSDGQQSAHAAGEGSSRTPYGAPAEFAGVGASQEGSFAGDDLPF